jgi:hypothetical protein
MRSLGRRAFAGRRRAQHHLSRGDAHRCIYGSFAPRSWKEEAETRIASPWIFWMIDAVADFAVIGRLGQLCRTATGNRQNSGLILDQE